LAHACSHLPAGRRVTHAIQRTLARNQACAIGLRFKSGLACILHTRGVAVDHEAHNITPQPHVHTHCPSGCGPCLGNMYPGSPISVDLSGHHVRPGPAPWAQHYHKGSVLQGVPYGTMLCGCMLLPWDPGCKGVSPGRSWRERPQSLWSPMTCGYQCAHLV